MNKEAVRPKPLSTFSIELNYNEITIDFLDNENLFLIEQEMVHFCTRFSKEYWGETTKLVGWISKLYDYEKVYQYFVELTSEIPSETTLESIEDSVPEVSPKDREEIMWAIARLITREVNENGNPE